MARATADNAIAIGAGREAKTPGAITIGSATTNANGENAVAIGSGSVANAANTVSVGNAGAERRITNVAAGTAVTDAVNVGQLNAAIAGVSGGAAG